MVLGVVTYQCTLCVYVVLSQDTQSIKDSVQHVLYSLQDQEPNARGGSCAWHYDNCLLHFPPFRPVLILFCSYCLDRGELVDFW